MHNPVFYNQQRSGYEEIFSYGPYFYKDILEMDANYRFAGKTLDLMAEKLETLVDDQFIAYADEETISRMERWMNIGYDGTRSLEDRRKKVQLMWNGGEKLSGRLIKSIVKSYTGCEETPSVKMTNHLIISAQIKEDNTVYISDLAELIERMKPAHIRAEIQLITTTKIKFHTNISHYIYQPDICGEHPDIAVLGAFLPAGLIVKTEGKDVVYEHNTSSEEAVAGTYQRISTHGAQLESGVSIGTEESMSVMSYVECGTSLCGEEGF